MNTEDFELLHQFTAAARRFHEAMDRVRYVLVKLDDEAAKDAHIAQLESWYARAKNILTNIAETDDAWAVGIRAAIARIEGSSVETKGDEGWCVSSKMGHMCRHRKNADCIDWLPRRAYSILQEITVLGKKLKCQSIREARMNWEPRECPLCGSKEIGTTGNRDLGYHGYCGVCKHYGPVRPTRDEARRAWNGESSETEVKP